MRDKVKADKKLLVAANMGLTESEAKGFWPVYEEYQKELGTINQRIVKLIESYAADYNAKSLTDEKAKKLVGEMVAIEQAEAAMQVVIGGGFLAVDVHQIIFGCRGVAGARTRGRGPG